MVVILFIFLFLSICRQQLRPQHRHFVSANSACLIGKICDLDSPIIILVHNEFRKICQKRAKRKHAARRNRVQQRRETLQTVAEVAAMMVVEGQGSGARS